MNISKTPNLPAISNENITNINTLIEEFKIPKGVLPEDEEIYAAWENLPRELKSIPENLRDERIARMCVAVSVGLFDGAINYIWNATILQLREKVKNFGLPIVSGVLQSDFEEKDLINYQDSRLLDLCLKLNLIDETGFFFLDQNRNIRNNYSAAHPSAGYINDREFVTFLNRCVKYALSEVVSPKGVDIKDFIAAVKGEKFNEDQKSVWVSRLNETHNAQRQMLIGMVHGLYCDPASSEPSRLNSLEICQHLQSNFTADIRSDLINRHQEYAAKGDSARHDASKQFFEKLNLVQILNKSEQHSIFHHRLEQLWNVHNAMNNFYNEPPFAERVLELSKNSAVPETVQEYFVFVIVACSIGNGYGISIAAYPFYEEIIKSFSPREIGIMLSFVNKTANIISDRIKNNSSCSQYFKKILLNINSDSVPNHSKNIYNQFVQ